MDTTQIEALLRALEEADPADAPEAADTLAEALEAALESAGPEGSTS